MYASKDTIDIILSLYSMSECYSDESSKTIRKIEIDCSTLYSAKSLITSFELMEHKIDQMHKRKITKHLIPGHPVYKRKFKLNNLRSYLK